MSTLETSIETDLRIGVEIKKGLCLKWTSPEYRGVPDRIVMMPNARIKFVETKAPDGVVKSWQDRCHKRLRALGFEVWVIWTPAQVNSFLKTL